MVGPVGCSREKQKVGAPCRPQPPSGFASCFLSFFQVLVSLSPFSCLLLPSLLGRRAEICHLAGPALCLHLAGPREETGRGSSQEIAASAYLSTVWQAQRLCWKNKCRDLCIWSLSRISSKELSKRRCLQSTIITRKWEPRTLLASLIQLGFETLSELASLFPYAQQTDSR